MRNVSEEFKTAIASPSPKFKSRITFPDLVLDDYQVRSINLDSLLVGSEDFEIGMAPMDMVQIELVYAPDEPIEYDFEGKECEIELGVYIPFTYNRMEAFTYGELEQYTYDEMEEGTPEDVALGLFTVERATKGVMILTLDCVDRMHKAEKEYISDLMYPTTLLDILQSASEQAGIPLATTTFANSDYIVPNEPVYEGVTCRKIFAQVAELAGGYAKINRRGQLEIVTLGVTLARDITKDHYIDFKINEVANARIDKVIVKVGEETATKGTGENIYTIVDNMFVQDPNNVVDALYSVLKNVSYTACTLKWQGDFSLDLGDKVTVDGNDTYVLSRKLTYTGGLREDYSAPAKSNIEKNSTGKGSLTLDIENVKTQIKVIDGEIKQTIERVENLVVGANNRLYDSQTEIPFGFNSGVGTVQLFRDQVHPYYKVTSNQNIDLFAAFPDSQFAESLSELGEVTISLDVLVDVDRVVTIDGKEYPVKGNRWTRIHVTKTFTENTTKRLRVRNPFSRKRARDIDIGTKLIDELSADINTLYYRNLKVERGNVATDWTLTPEELEVFVNRYKSEILQLADSISLRVSNVELGVLTNESQITILSNEISSKVSKGDIISEINQSAEEIRIQASKISLEGLVTANSNFKILEDGSIEAKNADISGSVTANSGAIGGWQLTSSLIQYRPNSSNNNNRFYLNSDPTGTYRIASYNSSGTRQFSVTSDGVLYATGADITGKITATSGSFPASLITGTLTATQINVSTLSSITSNLGTITGGSLNIGNGAFKVSSAGKLEATGADITGKITATSGSFPASLITGKLTANQINVSTLSAISANLGTITAGTINGVTINGSTFNVTAQSGDNYGLTIRRGLIEAKDSNSKVLFRLGGLTSQEYTGNSYRGGVISADSIISLRTYQSTGNTGIDITKNSGVQIWGGKLNAQYHIANFARGFVILNTSTWKRFTFNDGANPIVFRHPPIVVLTSQDGVSSISNGKVRNVTTTGFEAILGGSGYSDSTHGYIAYCPHGEVF